MFPSMRRHLQQISYERAIDILRKTTNAVLAIRDDITGYTYAVPVSPVYDEGHLYIHSAPMGHKIAALKANPKVSLCVIEKDEIHPETLTSHFRSVIVFGTARFVTEPKEKLAVLDKLIDKFAPDFRKEENFHRAKICEKKNIMQHCHIFPRKPGKMGQNDERPLGRS